MENTNIIRVVLSFLTGAFFAAALQAENTLFSILFVICYILIAITTKD